MSRGTTLAAISCRMDLRAATMSIPTVERLNPTSEELFMFYPSAMVKIQRIKFLANSNLVNEKFIALKAYYL
jgi:hypothetical protein